MKKRDIADGAFVMALVAVLVAAAFMPARSMAAEDEAVEASSRTVIKGDTLWDLAGKYYQDPYQWQKIWDANKTTVSDPNRIYPDQVLTIPGRDSAVQPPSVQPEAIAVKAEKEENTEAQAPQTSADACPDEHVENQPAVTSPAVEPDTETVASTAEYAPSATGENANAARVAAAETAPQPPAGKRYYSGDSFVAPMDWAADGMIVRDREKKLMLSEGDTVFINIGSDRTQPGMRYVICRKEGKIKDVSTGDVVGLDIRIIGALELTTQIGPDVSTAKIVNSNDPIQVGDLLVRSDAIPGK